MTNPSVMHPCCLPTTSPSWHANTSQSSSRVMEVTRSSAAIHTIVASCQSLTFQDLYVPCWDMEACSCPTVCAVKNASATCFMTMPYAVCMQACSSQMTRVPPCIATNILLTYAITILSNDKSVSTVE